MSKVVIKAEHLWKQYQIRRHFEEQTGSFKELLNRPFEKIIKRFYPSYQSISPQAFTALRDVSFEIQQGESIGLIGRNGAGKSTLLKILSRITRPTQGQVTLYERVNSLLEIGTGFNANLSGRDNVFLNGSFLGMKRFEIQKKFDEIVAFSEVEEFIDTPVKYYSSGMYVRLAFAVAVNLTPEILLLDEVLSVGDTGFQKKSTEKMQELLNSGATIILVSHNSSAVQQICKRAIWLGNGSIRVDGPSTEVVDCYLKSMG